ncbi:tyrosine-type recombinase/integrase [Rhodococcus sp. B10]|uniref:tyrosine-type recombinase/integrase n=1 Tax=Rhodococcus sp. B10 TaxID=2695876 RepID=UPI0014321B5A|nr:tyrosine-type recombinase/integrase [Rhodococcus sp. B10]NIL77681.1 putative prophage phiRv2 integrase [Rhodococcus sp. B10]
MAWTRKLPSGKYQGMYRDAHGKVRSAGSYPREKQALGKATAAEQDARLNPKDPAAQSMTWAQWEPLWLERRSVAPQTLTGDMSKIENHVRPRWGDVPLSKIEHDDVQLWVTQLGRTGGVRTAGSFTAGGPLSASTVEKIYRVLSASMKAAELAKLIDRTPCRGVKIVQDGNSPERYLTEAEQDAITDELVGQDRLLAKFGFATGMRMGEMQGVHWESIDLEAKSVTVRHAYDPKGRSMKAPKSYQLRSIPLTDEVVEMLRDRLDEHGPGLCCPVRHNRVTKCRSGLVFAQGADRKAIDADNFRHRSWARACSRAAVKDSQGRWNPVGHVRVHDMRHTFASTLVRAGIPLAEVCTLMGHSSITVTQRYAHLGRSQWGVVANVLNRRAAPRAAKPNLKVLDGTG